jgi:hypothetical protein
LCITLYLDIQNLNQKSYKEQDINTNKTERKKYLNPDVNNTKDFVPENTEKLEKNRSMTLLSNNQTPRTNQVMSVYAYAESRNEQSKTSIFIL